MKKELIIVQTFDKDGFMTGYKVNGEVVRCKDCRYKDAHSHDMDHCKLFGLWMNPDFFCADGAANTAGKVSEEVTKET